MTTRISSNLSSVSWTNRMSSASCAALKALLFTIATIAVIGILTVPIGVVLLFLGVCPDCFGLAWFLAIFLSPAIFAVCHTYLMVQNGRNPLSRWACLTVVISLAILFGLHYLLISDFKSALLLSFIVLAEFLLGSVLVLGWIYLGRYLRRGRA